MKKQKFLSLLLASTLVFSMGTSTVFASALSDGNMTSTSGGYIEDDSDLQEPIYKVVVPTDMVFALDPFQQTGDSQIHSADLTITNKSNVPVKVEVQITAGDKADNDVTFKTKEADVTETNTDKLVYMAAEIATTVVETLDTATGFGASNDVDVYADEDDPNGYNTTKTDGTKQERTDVKSIATTYGDSTTKVTIDGTTTPTKIAFALDKAEYLKYTAADASTANEFKKTAASNKGSAAFRFYGKVNTTAAWVESELTAKVAYSFQGLTGTNYTALTTGATGGQGYVKLEEAPTFTASETALVINYTKGLGNKALKSIDKIEFVHPTKGTFDVSKALTNSWAAATVTDSTITLDSGVNKFWTEDTTEATITYTMEDGSTGTVKVNVVTAVATGE